MSAVCEAFTGKALAVNRLCVCRGILEKNEANCEATAASKQTTTGTETAASPPPPNTLTWHDQAAESKDQRLTRKADITRRSKCRPRRSFAEEVHTSDTAETLPTSAEFHL